METASDGPVAPPRARAVPHRMEHLGHVRVDDYHWLNRRDDPEVQAYLEAENSYTKQVMAPTAALEEQLFEEIKGRIQQTDESVPYRLGDYLYWTRMEEGKEYPIFFRRPISRGAQDELLLDVNRMAEGHEFFEVGSRAVSEDQQLLAYTVDSVGRGIYTLQFKDLRTGRDLEDRVPETSAALVWANDNRTIFYVKPDLVTLRSYRVYKHALGTPLERDELVFEERDDTFWVRVWKTKSRRFVIIGSFQTETTECRFLDASDPGGEFQVLQLRERGHEYFVDHLGDQFYVKTNYAARNFRLMRTSLTNTGMRNWEEIVAHREDVLLEDFELFRNYLVLTEREDGLLRLRVCAWSGEADYHLPFDDPAYSCWIDANHDIDSTILRYGYTSLVAPKTIYDHDMASRRRTRLKQEPVLGGFDPADYRTERLWAVATDGTRIPVSLVYRNDAPDDGGKPLLLSGYGSYGYSLDAAFQSERLSLIDRGFTYAIAHVRGGQELGRRWYEDGKLLNKRNSFTDFIACAEHLVRQGYTQPDRLFAAGRSAGGLLIGSVVNLRGDLFRGVVAGVPFVDVITTMLDDTIPLTTFEYDEWGNPHDKTFYDYILSYSPYDNVEARAYPHMLVTTGLHDAAVQYWEPAKWVAKLRATKTDTNRLLLKTNMGAGHGGASGRYRRYRETAFEYAFLLDLAGLAG